MRWLLRLYPRIWRERYENEMLALLEDHKITPATFFDLLLGALDANLNYDGVTEGMTHMLNRLRSGIVMVFCSFVLFGLGWCLIQRINDPVNLFQEAAKSHPEFTILHDAIFICGCLAILALMLGGLPLFFVAIKRAIKNKQKDVLTPLWIAVSCLFLFIISTGILADWQHISFARDHMYIFLISYFIVFLMLLAVGTFSVSIIVSRADFKLSELKFVFIPEITIFFSMIVSASLSILFIISLIFYAPQLLNTQDVGSAMFITGILLMMLSTIFAALGLKHGMVRDINILKISE